MAFDDSTVGRHWSSDELRAEAACRALINAFIDCTDGVDGRRPTDMLKLFSEACTYVTTNRPGQRLDKAGLAVYFGEMDAFISERRYKHLITNVHFTLLDPTHARTRSRLTTFALSHPDVLGVDCLQELRDEFVLEADGHWRFLERVYSDHARRPVPPEFIVP